MAHTCGCSTTDRRAAFHMLLLMAGSIGLVLCPNQRFAFYHVPKTAGNSISKQLAETEPNCTWIGGILTAAEAGEWLGLQSLCTTARHRLRVDAMHTTPAQLEEFSARGLLRVYNNTNHAPNPPQRPPWLLLDTDAVQREWTTVALVRSPYMRVLSAFEQRIKYRSMLKRGSNPTQRTARCADSTHPVLLLPLCSLL